MQVTSVLLQVFILLYTVPNTIFGRSYDSGSSNFSDPSPFEEFEDECDYGVRATFQDFQRRHILGTASPGNAAAWNNLLSTRLASDKCGYGTKKFNTFIDTTPNQLETDFASTTSRYPGGKGDLYWSSFTYKLFVMRLLPNKTGYDVHMCQSKYFVGARPSSAPFKPTHFGGQKSVRTTPTDNLTLPASLNGCTPIS